GVHAYAERCARVAHQQVGADVARLYLPDRRHDGERGLAVHLGWPRTVATVGVRNRGDAHAVPIELVRNRADHGAIRQPVVRARDRRPARHDERMANRLPGAARIRGAGDRAVDDVFRRVHATIDAGTADGPGAGAVGEIRVA